MRRIAAQFAPSAVLALYALPALAVETGLGETAKEAGFGSSAPDVTVVIGRVISAALGLLGIIFLLLVIYGGFLWMTAQGNEQTVDKAKKVLVAAVIGLVIISAGYAISTFVVNEIVGATTGEG